MAKTSNTKFTLAQLFLYWLWCFFCVCCGADIALTVSYLNVEWDTDEHVSTYGDDDSHEISLWENKQGKPIRQGTVQSQNPTLLPQNILCVRHVHIVQVCVCGISIFLGNAAIDALLISCVFVFRSSSNWNALKCIFIQKANTIEQNCTFLSLTNIFFHARKHIYLPSSSMIIYDTWSRIWMQPNAPSRHNSLTKRVMKEISIRWL